MSSWHWVIFPIVLLLVWQVSQVCACFAVIVGRGASADGSVLVGHNEENHGRHVLHFRRVPRQQFEPAALVRLRRGGELAQVPETWAFLWSENPGLEFSDGYLNEWGVTVVSNGCPTREDDYDALVARGEIRSGGIGYMLRRLVAQRARNAREGVLLVGRLVERFGYVHSGRTYIIADPSEAWLVAVARGRHWIARRVPDDAAVVLPNVHILGAVDLADRDNFLGSPDLIDYAAGRGWFDPEGGEPFCFWKVYQTEERAGPDLRQWRCQQLLTGRRRPWPPEEPLPFAVTPARKLTVAAVARLLRNRTSQVSLYHPATQESAVFQLRSAMPAAVGCVYWRTSSRPDTSVLVPWYLGVTETPQAYYPPGDLTAQLGPDRHFNPPEGTFQPNPDLAWWTFQGLQDLVDEDYQAGIKIVRPAWTAFETRVFDDQQAVEQKALGLYETDQAAARAHLTAYSADVAARAGREAQRLAERIRAPL